MAQKHVRKSGDSRRQDAARIQMQEQEESHGAAAIAEELQGSVEEAKERGASRAEVEAMAEALKKLERVCAALETQNQDLVRSFNESQARRGITTPPPELKCPTCFQVLADKQGRGVCKGQHVKIDVVPPSPAFWKVFQGVIYNGVTYAGRCWVPPEIADEVKAMANRQIYNNEMPMHIPGGKVFGDVDMKKAVYGATPIIEPK